MIINFGIIVILQTGAVRVNNGKLTQGQVVALVNYMGQILVELLKLANLIILMSRSYACTKRVIDIFNITDSLKDGEFDFLKLWQETYESNSCTASDSAVPPTIEFEEAGFAYPKSHYNPNLIRIDSHCNAARCPLGQFFTTH